MNPLPLYKYDGRISCARCLGVSARHKGVVKLPETLPGERWTCVGCKRVSAGEGAPLLAREILALKGYGDQAALEGWIKTRPALPAQDKHTSTLYVWAWCKRGDDWVENQVKVYETTPSVLASAVEAEAREWARCNGIEVA